MIKREHLHQKWVFLNETGETKNTTTQYFYPIPDK